MEALSQEYIQTFIQRHPKYALKSNNTKKWTTRKKPLADPAILAHLNGKYAIAGVAQWYPRYACIDLDDAPIEKVCKVMQAIGLDESNSLLCASESANSYHVYFIPTMKGKPPTINLLQECFSEIITQQAVELYPQAAKCFRLPFSPSDQFLTETGEALQMDWQQKLYWFQKLDEFDLSSFIKQQTKKADKPEVLTVPTGTYKQGLEYMEFGLTEPSSRHHAQFCVLYALWRQNNTIDNAIEICRHWIKNKNNSMSKDFSRNQRVVYAEIGRQAKHIWNNYELNDIYPDAAHNTSYGYLTKSDLIEIIKVCEGSLTRIKFLGSLIRYCNPRQTRQEINVHSDKLKSWASKDTYLKYLDELIAKGIIKQRTAYYVVGQASKAITLNWDFQSPEDAIRADGRTIDILTSIANAFAQRELQLFMESIGVKNKIAYQTASSIYVNRGNVIELSIM